MKVPRFRVRTLLVLVALAGLASEGVMLWGRSAEVSTAGPRSPSWHERENAETEAWMCRVWTGYLGKTGIPGDSSRYNRARERYAGLKLVYQRAARYPWLTPPHDPAEWGVEW